MMPHITRLRSMLSHLIKRGLLPMHSIDLLLSLVIDGCFLLLAVGPAMVVVANFKSNRLLCVSH